MGCGASAADRGGGGGQNSTAPEPTKKELVSADELFTTTLTFLQRVPLFRLVGKAELPKVAAKMTHRTWRPLDVVFRQGEDGDEFFLVMAGQAEVRCRMVGDKQERVIATLHAGDYFGEGALLRGEPRGATVTAQSNLETLSLTQAQFDQLGFKDCLVFPERRAVAVCDEAVGDSDESEADEEQDATVDEEDQQRVVQAIRGCAEVMDHFQFDPVELGKLAKRAVVRHVPEGTSVIEQGNKETAQFYVIKSGRFVVLGYSEASVDDLLAITAENCTQLQRTAKGALGRQTGDQTVLAELGPGQCFGQTALIHNCERKATVCAKEGAVVFSIDRMHLTRIRRDKESVEREKIILLLNEVRLFDVLLHEEKMALADGMWEVHYSAGEAVCTQGDTGDTTYIVVRGECSVAIDGVVQDKRLRQGQCFGERAIIADEPRAATIAALAGGAELLAISREAFNLVVGPLSAIQDQVGKMAHKSKLAMNSKGRATRQSVGDVLGGLTQRATLRWRSTVFSAVGTVPEWKQKIANVGLTDLRVVCKLGQGGFGRVTLEKHDDLNMIFAVKQLNRDRLRKLNMERKAATERDVLNMVDSRFIIRLYMSYMNQESIYFVLEVCLGGELFAILHMKRLYKKEPHTRYYTACVTEAFAHLHERHIIFRDLKPENVLLDWNGQGKLCDMGLAKFCVGKAYTLCGTPEYMAPEVIKAQGYGKAVDWWTLGIFVFELATSRPPFEGSSPYEIYKKIRGGYDQVSLPDILKASDKTMQMVASLLEAQPSRRLPMQPAKGLQALRELPFFSDTKFEWSKLRDGTMTPPYIPKLAGPEDTAAFNHHAKKEQVEQHDPTTEYENFENF